MLKHIQLKTKERDVVALTDDIKAFVSESGIQEGLCVVCTPHTTRRALISSTSTIPRRMRPVM